MIVKNVTVYNFERFENKLASLNKKIAKMGANMHPVQVGRVVEEQKTVKNRFLEDVEVFSHYEVELLMGEELVAFPGGWQLVGVIDHTENLVRCVPDFAGVPLTPFVERGSVCDHCGFDRNRNETFIVLDVTGKFLQVGRQCVGQLLGIAPERVLAQVDVVKELLEDDEWLGERKTLGTVLNFYLTHVACMIRTAGWRSRTTAKLEGTSATADMAFENMSNQQARRKNRYGQEMWVDPSAADYNLANQVEIWLEDVAKRTGLSDYMSNLAQIGINKFVTPKSAGFAASAINAYLKEKEEAIKLAARRAESTSQHVGKVGDRITTVVNKVSSAGFDSMYGYTFFHRMIDEFGNVLVWKTGTEMENGKYKVTGTVKSHDDYKGEPQTSLTRCKLGMA